ncbi:uncharacterized protein LOC142318520 [Lycorma delicatula]|uniref:uncharacterized protein LOC142318520 n=1 Tax=Lycorma delicatula TaxID=130591 RepID=UPI003F516701
MDELDRCTSEHALLFSLKAGLCALKTNQWDADTRSPEQPDDARSRYRRGSSLTDLDRFYEQHRTPTITTGSIPATPTATLKNNNVFFSGLNARGNCISTGSIGDLMNQSRHYVSSSSQETMLARALPLSTVKQSFSSSRTSLHATQSLPLTCFQRTERLSRLIRQQRASTTVLLKKLIKKCVMHHQGNNDIVP